MPGNWNDDNVDNLLAKLTAPGVLDDNDKRLLHYIISLAQESISTQAVREEFERGYVAGALGDAAGAGGGGGYSGTILASIRRLCDGIR